MQPYDCQAVTVYCSSSNRVDRVYCEAARELGRLIAKNGYSLVFGGGKVGLMGALSAGARANCGKVVGVILKSFQDMGVADPGVEEMRVVDEMRDRKRGLEEAGDAYIALPGGFGTFEEITEIISFKQLGFHNKPVILVNTNHYFDHLIRQFEDGFAKDFIESRFRASYQVVENPQQAIDYIKYYRPPQFDVKYRWSLRK